MNFPRRDEFPQWGSSARKLSRPKGAPQRLPQRRAVLALPGVAPAWAGPTTWTLNGTTMGSSSIWHTWTTAGTSTNVWNTWANNSAATITTANVWDDWVRNVGAGVDAAVVDPQTYQRIREREETWRAEEAERTAKAERAKVRAYELLDTMLNPEQRRTLKDRGWFEVLAPSGRLYRINRGTHGNIDQLDPVTHRKIAQLCVAPQYVPAGDAMVVQKLMLETQEELLRETANITSMDPAVPSTYSRGLLTGDRMREWLAQRNERRAAA